ncbi:MAG TPA: YdeI/OmpD-associated family protein [Verrucomicrobiae bacterium]|jgi:uncharacterized protein YdeI (YjbR/CyaY-like superfamily)|nr:YdeI/OmpD-associated family protein [Verrucomicrobiae bacterium]
MPANDPRIDAYIAKSPDFARPILNHIRQLVHAACPEARETIKWQMPHFEHKGVICGMAAFKQHCRLFFWKRALIFGKGQTQDRAQGQLGNIASLADLPDDKILAGYIKKAVELNEAGIKNPLRAKSRTNPKVVVPDFFLAALKKNKKTLASFEKFSPSHRREYIEWITEAKREETRAKRLKTALEWIAQGKPRNWKYL